MGSLEREPQRLTTGDVVLIRGGVGHSICDAPGTRPQPHRKVLEAMPLRLARLPRERAHGDCSAEALDADSGSELVVPRLVDSLLVYVVRAWLDGQPDGAAGSARARVDDVLLGLSPDQVGAFWIDQRVRSGVAPPRTIHSQEMLLRVVASMRGVIGYVELPVHGLPREVQALTIDGQSPQDPEYPGALR